jgi:nitrilase
VWSAGDGHGLRVHPPRVPCGRIELLGKLDASPARGSLRGQNLHVAVWPKASRDTRDITRLIALDSQSYLVSVSGLIGAREDIGAGSWRRKMAAAGNAAILADGGSW